MVSTLNRKLHDPIQDIATVRTLKRKVSSKIIKNDESSLGLSKLFTNDTSFMKGDDSTIDPIMPV